MRSKWDIPAVPQKASESQVPATPSSFDNFMLKMRKKVGEQGFPAQATPEADKASIHDETSPAAQVAAQPRPEEDKPSLDAVSSTAFERPKSRMSVRGDFRDSSSSLNMSLLNKCLPTSQSSSSSGLKAIKNESSGVRDSGFRGTRPLPALPDRSKKLERPTANPRIFEPHPESKPIETTKSHQIPTTARNLETLATANAASGTAEAHIAHLQLCLEIHTLLLTRVNALPVNDSSPVIPKLHGYLSSCERRLHYLLRNAPGSAFQDSASSSMSEQHELAEQCINTLELVTKETLAIEARNVGEISRAENNSHRNLEANEGVDVGGSGSESKGRSDAEYPDELAPEKVDLKKRSGHRSLRKSKSKRKTASAVDDEQ